MQVVIFLVLFMRVKGIYLGLAEKVCMAGVGVRSQESGGIGNLEEVVGYIYPFIFLPLLAQNPNFLVAQA
ncbi:MAG: hypothetical protein F6K24_55755 [Okeania sp. SIO2D1]|nr:hypothetical protein [Okeania sp. SIO2D1]